MFALHPRSVGFTGEYGECTLGLDCKETTMTNPNDRHVVPNPDGGWDVRKPDATRSSAHTDTQAEAISRGEEIVHNAGGGELNIHGRDGRIRDKRTVAPGNDPFPPRG
jgi:hypothetical protein